MFKPPVTLLHPARLLVALVLHFGALSTCFAADPIQVTIPSTPSQNNVVGPDFLGISFELSFLNEYFGDNVSSIPPTVVNYLTSIRKRTGDFPVRLRVGGNSMDSSKYVPEQTSFMVQLADPSANFNNQPVNYGPVLWETMNKVASDVGGANYLIGLPLMDPNDPLIPLAAGAAQQVLGNTLDGFLLGNEPDLYNGHGYREGYTIDKYIEEFRTASNLLTNTSAGNLLTKRNLAGPTICCDWDLAPILTSGYISNFESILKYITVQHYPQNNCFGKYAYELPYYTQHVNVVGHAQWQQAGVSVVRSTKGLQAIMSEFNTASCGGIPGISDTFAAGSLWTIDYALQLASVGFSAAYIHTRERGISYNLFAPPEGPNGGPGSWTTNPPYYALLAIPELLTSAKSNATIVQDLDVGHSKTDNTTVAGYAVYDAGSDHSVQRIVLFNYANTAISPSTSAAFNLPSSAFSGVNAASKKAITVKYLTAVDLKESTRIAWAGETLAGVGDGKLVSSSEAWAVPTAKVDCSNGCTVDVPGPGMAVVFVDAPSAQSGATVTGTSPNSSSSTGKSGASSSVSYRYGKGRLALLFSSLLAGTLFCSW